ncbi:MAG TPA: YebC/PmpR family DNA-binding transcriptional regulator [Candidatus Hydrogenedentes bacterium]|jgi:YebC/PmpR family DNA-binding regulatory protein|nr:MAG: putative transcriptional regulatory protein [Candidatus Hydrogenedentes bacterium ADurb.Bin170]HOD95191.1 YebC/PmpR family DNA-binding transcriptional regulator [Candidatus Hydrogenedentota bacterium]HOH43338.1 YebC/PmpR family DNA-binding transcriptional regulator [Candidatus Hydrogenedentota bacterium]HOM48280.1 YebC/PmpR family DNA-binding transcriptional regulator [Candidatus Hydrogenedentota bacterium]HOR50538.1 YebC/PmpR family DNA-binding transcriptional regulator [Candidatus Hyd
MSGHSKWSTIKRKKGAADAKRGKIFSKLAKEITVAARLGGGDPAANPRLRSVLLAARTQNMPGDNVDRAIKKGTGELPGVTYDEVRYEAYAPGGVALIIDVLTDNKNRTVSEIRHLVSKLGGNMAEAGAVAWNFEPQGLLTIPKEGISEEEMFDKAIEAGAEDVSGDGDAYEIRTAPTQLHAVAGALEAAGTKAEEVKLTMMPKTTMELTGKQLLSCLRMIEELEDHDDVQDVFSNLNITDEAMAEVMDE